MSDFNKSLERISKISENHRKKRQEEWAMIQKETPKIAEFLTELKSLYGKPEAVQIESGSKVIFTKGVLLPERIGIYLPKHHIPKASKTVEFKPRTYAYRAKIKK